MVCSKHKFLTLHNAGLGIPGCGLMIAKQHTLPSGTRLWRPRGAVIRGC